MLSPLSDVSLCPQCTRPRVLNSQRAQGKPAGLPQVQTCELYIHWCTCAQRRPRGHVMRSLEVTACDDVVMMAKRRPTSLKNSRVWPWSPVPQCYSQLPPPPPPGAAAGGEGDGAMMWDSRQLVLHQVTQYSTFNAKLAALPERKSTRLKFD